MIYDRDGEGVLALLLFTTSASALDQVIDVSTLRSPLGKFSGRSNELLFNRARQAYVQLYLCLLLSDSLEHQYAMHGTEV